MGKEGTAYLGGLQCCVIQQLVRHYGRCRGSDTHFQNVGLNAMARAETAGDWMSVLLQGLEAGLP